MSGRTEAGCGERRFLPVDGGSGARSLSSLMSRSNRLRAVSSPRHAEIMLVFEPVTTKLTRAMLELYRAMPRPRTVLAVGEAAPGGARLEDFFSRLERIVPGAGGAAEIERRMQILALHVDDAPQTPLEDGATIPLPGKRERELATEYAVLSLGPVQPFTAGPLRLLLACDGEQVASVKVEAGYAARNVTGAMTHADWPEAARLASLLDPLAPVTCRLAFVNAIEELQRRPAGDAARAQRSATLALERAANHVAWLVRFAALIGAPWLLRMASELEAELDATASSVWDDLPLEWIGPQRDRVPARAAERGAALARLATHVDALRKRVERDRALRLRTAGIGALPAEGLDVFGRLIARLRKAAADLRLAAEPGAGTNATGQSTAAVWRAPAGTARASVEGPRGAIELVVTSDGERLSAVEWRTPSVALLGLLPSLLEGEKLADAQAIVASLDLSMAEADG